LRVPSLKGILQIAPFFDLGRTWNMKGDAPANDSLASAGVGLIWRQGKAFTARFDWGFPLTHVEKDFRQEGPHFSLLFNPF
jgi:hemolysin activation/secretion protein